MKKIHIYYINIIEKIRTLTNDNHTQFIKEDERYGIVIKTNKGKKVVLFGGIDILEEIENSLFAVNRVNFSIGAIPEVKNENLLSVIYGEKLFGIKIIGASVSCAIKNYKGRYKNLIVQYLDKELLDEYRNDKNYVFIKANGIENDN